MVAIFFFLFYWAPPLFIRNIFLQTLHGHGRAIPFTRTYPFRRTTTLFQRSAAPASQQVHRRRRLFPPATAEGRPLAAALAVRRGLQRLLLCTVADGFFPLQTVTIPSRKTPFFFQDLICWDLLLHLLHVVWLASLTFRSGFGFFW